MSAKPNDQTKAPQQRSNQKPAEPPRLRHLPTPPPQAVEGRVGALPREIGGPKGPEPTRYGDWEVGGRCTDF